LERLGWAAREQGDGATAWARLSESLAIFRELDDAAAIAGTLNTLAGVAIMDENPAQAEALLEESRALGQSMALDTAIWTLNHLGQVAQLRGDYARAAQLHHECLTDIDSHYQDGFAYHVALLAAYLGLGETALGLGNLE